MTAVDRLFVLWADPAAQTRHVVGELWRDGGEFCFAYAHEVEQARSHGFDMLPQFRELRDRSRPYRSRSLFSTFAQRIPSRKRPDYHELLLAWGLPDTEQDAFAILAHSGGVQVTDRLELAEYRAVDDDLARPLQFRVAGTRHYGNDERVRVGDVVELQPESTNAFDDAATVVLLIGGAKLGYVPRYYAPLVRRHLREGHQLDAFIERRLVIPTERGRWVVHVSKQSAALKARESSSDDPFRLARLLRSDAFAPA